MSPGGLYLELLVFIAYLCLFFFSCSPISFAFRKAMYGNALLSLDIQSYDPVTKTHWAIWKEIYYNNSRLIKNSDIKYNWGPGENGTKNVMTTVTFYPSLVSLPNYASNVSYSFYNLSFSKSLSHLMKEKEKGKNYLSLSVNFPEQIFIQVH